MVFALFRERVPAAALKGQGVVVEPIRFDELRAERFTFFTDPDGLPLELCEVT